MAVDGFGEVSLGPGSRHWDNFIGHQVRRGDRNLLITGIALLVVATLWGMYYHQVVSSVLFAPIQMDEASLTVLRVVSDEPQPLVAVHGSRSHDLASRRGVRDPLRHSLVALEVGAHLLLVQTRGDLRATSFTGSFRPVDDRDMLWRLQALNPKWNGMVYDFVLITEAKPGVFWPILGFGTLILLAGGTLRAWWRRQGNPLLHPSVQALKAFGDPLELARQIQAELDGTVYHRVPGHVLTRSWLLFPTTYGVDLARVNDIIWAYPKVTRHKALGLITTSTTHEVVVEGRQGHWQIGTRKEQGASLLEKLNVVAPWIAIGYDKEREDLWERDRRRFIDLVDQKRRVTIGEQG